MRFARRIRSAQQLLRYLPELIEEMFLEVSEEDGKLVKGGWMEDHFMAVIEYCRSPKGVPAEAALFERNPVVDHEQLP